jgi:hypothetical protein
MLKRAFEYQAHHADVWNSLLHRFPQAETNRLANMRGQHSRESCEVWLESRDRPEHINDVRALERSFPREHLE